MQRLPNVDGSTAIRYLRYAATEGERDLCSRPYWGVVNIARSYQDLANCGEQGLLDALTINIRLPKRAGHKGLVDVDDITLWFGVPIMTANECLLNHSLLRRLRSGRNRQISPGTSYSIKTWRHLLQRLVMFAGVVAEEIWTDGTSETAAKK